MTKAYFYESGCWQPQHRSFALRQSLLARISRIKQQLRRRGRGARPDRREIALMIGTGTRQGYNQALKLHRRLAAAPTILDMAYLDHAEPLRQGDFPHYWRQPVYQAYLPQEFSTNLRLLICFTGMARALNMPIPAFHAKAIKAFDGIAYFFDEENDFYTKTQSRLEHALHSLLEMAAWKNVALIGTSGGGTITLRLPDLPLIHRRISSSPPVLRDQQLVALLEREDFATFRNSRIFFAYGNPTDTRHYKHLRDKLPADLFEQCVFNLAWASHSHGTLGTVMRLGALDDQLRWLSQGRDTSKEVLISSPAA